MRRRAFIACSGAMLVSARHARAQQSQRISTVGILFGGVTDSVWDGRLANFRQAMASLGWRDGVNVRFDEQRVGRDMAAIRLQAGQMVAARPDVILAGPSNTVKPLLEVTRTIPVVFVMVSDPIAQGIVDSIARPSGNATGFTNLEYSMLGKWIDLLKELAPGTKRVALMISSVNQASPGWYRTFQELAPKAGVIPLSKPISVAQDVDSVLAELAKQPGGALIVPGDTLVGQRDVRRRIIEIAARLRVPALYTAPDYVAEGGLVSYGIDEAEPFRLAAGYVDRILKGEKPSDLPVQQPTRFRFSINLKTAKALGLTVPLTLQVAADEVIE
jgi:putative ABC transport system substrate-binding protein